MSTKKLIIMTIAVLLTLDILTVAMLALFFPKTQTGFVRSEHIDESIKNDAAAAKNPKQLTNFENLVRLQMELDKLPYFKMEKQSSVKAEQTSSSYTMQSVYDTKIKQNNQINYQSIQIKEKGAGIADVAAPGNDGTKMLFNLATEEVSITKASSVADKDTVVWGNSSTTLNKTEYIFKYGNWGNYMTDYFFANQEDIQNADEKSVQYDASTQRYTLTVVANASAAVHYKNKVLTLGNGSVHDVVFKNGCATITFEFDENWKMYSYTIEEDYTTETKIIFTIKTNTHASHQAKFFY